MAIKSISPTDQNVVLLTKLVLDDDGIGRGQKVTEADLVFCCHSEQMGLSSFQFRQFYLLGTSSHELGQSLPIETHDLLLDHIIPEQVCMF